MFPRRHVLDLVQFIDSFADAGAGRPVVAAGTAADATQAVARIDLRVHGVAVRRAFFADVPDQLDSVRPPFPAGVGPHVALLRPSPGVFVARALRNSPIWKA